MTEFPPDRKPFATANWKMARTIAEGQAFLRQLRHSLGDVAAGLLDSPHVDGLGAGRKGRDPEAFAEIIRLIAQARGAI